MPRLASRSRTRTRPRVGPKRPWDSVVSRRLYCGPSPSQGASPSTSNVRATATSAPPGQSGKTASVCTAVHPLLIAIERVTRSLPGRKTPAPDRIAGLTDVRGAQVVEHELVVRGGVIVTAGGAGECDLGITEGRISQIGGALRGRTGPVWRHKRIKRRVIFRYRHS